jgi:hypothetical protein
MVKTRDDIVREEFEKTIFESAEIKMRSGNTLQFDQVNEGLAEFIKQYDWVWLFWPEPLNASGKGASIARDTGKKEGSLRCQSFPCADRATALKLYELCRGPDNHAPAFPPEPDQPYS